MGRSPTRSRSSKHTSNNYKRSHRQRSRSVERESSRSTSKYSSRKSRHSRSRSRTPSKYSSSKSSSKYQSSRRRRRSSSSSSASSYSSSSRSPSPEKKPVKKAEVAEPKIKEVVFDSVNLLHDQDKKVALDDLDQDAFVQKEFSSKKKPENIIVDVQAQTVPVPPPVDSLLHHGVSDERLLQRFGGLQLNSCCYFQLFGDDEGRMEKWVKKLYNFRQKAGQDVT